jgi:hypothetical protein
VVTPLPPPPRKILSVPFYVFSCSPSHHHSFDTMLLVLWFCHLKGSDRWLADLERSRSLSLSQRRDSSPTSSDEDRLRSSQCTCSAFTVRKCHSMQSLCCGSGIRCRDELNPDHISESLETNFFGYKYLNYLTRIPVPGWKKFG